MSACKKSFAIKIYSYSHFFILLICINQILSESASVSREHLQEEQLLPVRITRDASESGTEGSGDDENTPIRTLHSQVMERMTLKENKILDESIEEAKSKETVEEEEGSGFEDVPVKASQNATAEVVEESSSEDESSSESNDEVETTAKEDEVTTVPAKVTEIDLVTATVKEEITVPLETTTEKNKEEEAETVEITQAETTTETKEVTVLPGIKPEEHAEAETTTAEATTLFAGKSAESQSEPEAVTEVIEVKHVKPVFAVEATTKTEPPTTVPPATVPPEVVPPEIVPPVTVPPETVPPATVPPATIPPVTVPPATVPPATIPPVTVPPATVPPATIPPVTVPPATVPPATIPPEIVPPEIVPPVTVPPAIVTDNVTTIENENFTAGSDTLLMKIKSRLLDTNESVLDSSKDPSRLGTYIVISLILLSFLSLIGFILMKRRVQKRRKSNMDPETLDTEKALLSLSEYKDHPDGMDEGKIKNNEITPIVIKSNSQINKFEKNTNFSSPKNLNTKANEKNVEKDNVLKSTSDNLTQVIIEEPTKDVEEEKSPTNAEKLIVRTHLDQDSIPKKPVIVNRTSLGCVPVSQD